MLPNLKIKENDFLKQIKHALKQALVNLEVNFQGEIQLTHPTQKDFGDYSTNLAMIAYKKINQQAQWQSPRDFAQAIVDQLKLADSTFIKNVEIAGPGFINFYFKIEAFVQVLDKIIIQQQNFAKLDLGAGKTIAVEFAHPNTHKVFHIGHLRNITIGESLVRILENAGFKVERFNYQGDVGLHIAKCLYGIMNTDNYQQILDKMESLQDRIKFIGENYVKGSTAYKNDKQTQEEIHQINYLIYAAAEKYYQQTHNESPGSTTYLNFVVDKQDEMKAIFDLWLKTRQWSLDFFKSIYQRVYTHFDRLFFESECLAGVDIAKKALKKDILQKSNGAVIFDGSKHGLDTRVFINSLGLPTYEGKELKLAFTQFSEYPNLEKIIHVVAPEQTSFFAVTFKVEELLDSKFVDKQYHKKYAFVNLKSGKMSSRTGQIVTGEWLLDEAKQQILNLYPNLDNQLAETIGVAAVKYSFLKVSTTQEIAFDFKESISFEGNSGPYLQYAYARIQSLIKKANKAGIIIGQEFIDQKLVLDPQEEALLKFLYQFEEIVTQSAIELEPHHISTYLFSLAQTFSAFYNKCPIITLEDKLKASFRLSLSYAVALILAKGLDLLGIRVVEKM